jgi:hypothetical protein
LRRAECRIRDHDDRRHFPQHRDHLTSKRRSASTSIASMARMRSRAAGQLRHDSPRRSGHLGESPASPLVLAGPRPGAARR